MLKKEIIDIIFIIIGDDMKRIFKLIFLVLTFIPIFINATSTYNEGTKATDNYIVNFSNYKRYINIVGNKYYNYEKNGYIAQGSFKNGGFISSYEYKLSLDNKGSWLAPGIGYWTSSKDGTDNYYFVSDALYSKHMNDRLAVRITEYIQPFAKVKGQGTINNPWYFVESYMIRLKSNNESYGNLESGSNLGPQEMYIEKGTTKSINFTASPGYGISSSNISNCFSNYFLVEGNKITIRSLDRDLNCIIYFEPKKYTVTLDSNGGTPANYTREVTYKEKYGSMPEPTRTGYSFDGWYTEKTGGSKVTSTTDVTITNNQTLYAHWNPNSYTVTFVGNGGTMGSTTTKNVSYGSTYGDLSVITATRTGYTFTGWYTAASKGTKVTSATKVTQAKDHTLYAQWKANTYTVTFNQSGGTTPNPPSKPVTYHSTYGTLATTSRVGYTLKGWYTSALNGTQVTSTSKVTITGAQTLYARWNANKYTVKFNANGGTQPANQTVTYNSTYGTLPTTTRSGYVFTGWYTSNTGGTRVYNTTKVKITSTQTLYARWEVNAPTDLPKSFDKSGAYTYDVKATGIYKLETWGAQGGDIWHWEFPLTADCFSPLNKGGYGAYATGQIKLTAGTKLYIYVGGKGGTGGRTSPAGAGLPPIMSPGNGGYNGGGSGGYGSSSSYPYDDSNLKYAGGSGGGGATHIATTSGLLSTLRNKKSNILIVAGGGGGVQGSGECDTVRPNAGGISGVGNRSTGATQTTGYSFGQGQAGRRSYSYYNCGAEGSGGAGGGYYGGYAYQGTGEYTSTNGAGGSSYIGNTNLTNKVMYCYNCTTSSATNTKTNKTTSVSESLNANSAKMGDGAARITWIGAE